MNFYKHHIGDFDQATRHLSFVEDAAYSRLIRKYYAEEAPLPKDLKKIQRLIGARTKEEKAAVEMVLEEFFVLGDDGYHQNRCDEELEAARAKADVNRRVGKLGGRPRKTETQEEPTNNPNGLLFETQTVSENNPSQTPDTRHQTPEETTPSAPTEKISLDAGGRWQGIQEAIWNSWIAAYPALHLDSELAKAAAWVIANPKNKKSNYARFLTNWLTRAQDSAPRHNVVPLKAGGVVL